MKKHTNLWNEIEMGKPNTAWHSPLVGVAIALASMFIVYVVVSFVS